MRITPERTQWPILYPTAWQLVQEAAAGDWERVLVIGPDSMTVYNSKEARDAAEYRLTHPAPKKRGRPRKNA